MDFNDRIAALAELEKHVLPLTWQIDETNEENIVDSNGLFVAETCSDDDAVFIVVIRNEALPLLREMAQALSEAQAERDALQAECDALRHGHDKTYQMIDRISAALDYKPLGLTAEQAVEKVISILDEDGES